MLRSIFGTFQRFAWIALYTAEIFCFYCGCFLAIIAGVIHSSLGLKEALVFFVPSVLMTLIRRRWERL
jgi:hypothetical protein